MLAARERLHRAAVATQTQECAHCGSNEQFKVHVRDPDGHFWHFYGVDREVEPSDVHRCLEGDDAVLPWGRVVNAEPGLAPADALTLFRAATPGDTVRVAGGTDADAGTLRAAGFRRVERIDAAIDGHKPPFTDGRATRIVIYKGPRREFRDEFGNVYRHHLISDRRHRSEEIPRPGRQAPGAFRV